jgi:hypothetical protein
MIDVGWLSIVDGKVEIPNYDDHLSQSAKARAVEAKRKRVLRNKTSAKARTNVRSDTGQNSDQRREEKSINSSLRKSSGFTPPTVEEVREYCTERGNKIDPEHFVSYYAGNGWMRGKNKIKDWKSCVITWEKNDNERTNHARGGVQHSGKPSGGTLLSREQQREDDQLGVISNWARRRAGEMRPEELREGDGPSLCHEADGEPD